MWFSPSYSPQTPIFYVASREIGSVYLKRETKFERGAFYPRGGENELSPDGARGSIRALDAKPGNLCWKFELVSPPWAGVLSTARGLLFSGSNEGNFYALDVRTGKPLWDFQTGGCIGPSSIAFQDDGYERIAISADRILYVSGNWSVPN